MQFLKLLLPSLFLLPALATDNQGYPLGSGSTWKHADAIAGGSWYNPGQLFREDMIVKWSDGEVTLYTGNAGGNKKAPFLGEVQLAKSGSIFKSAVRIAPDNDGGLYVLWVDGEVTLYKRVDRSGFHDELQLIGPNSIWRDHASHIAGVRGDLVVVWSDGEVSKYLAPKSNKLGKETQLQKPNATWKNVRSLSSGDFCGFVLGTDLLVRWVDGELSVYCDLDTYGLTYENQWLRPSDTWTHATVVSGRGAGSSQVIVRWSDGEVSLYPDAFFCFAGERGSACCALR